MRKKFTIKEKVSEYYNSVPEKSRVMKIAIYPAHPGQDNQAIRLLTDAGVLDIADIDIYRVGDRLKSQPRPAMTICHTHRLERVEGRRARCRLCGQSFPLNRKGEIDKDELVREMLQPTRSFWK